MLKRQYPGQLSKPEVQLSLNTGASVTNNTLVITAEQAQGLKLRNVALDEQLQRLVPPGSQVKDKLGDTGEGKERIANATGESLVNNLTPSITKSSSVVLAGEGAAPTRTPDACARGCRDQSSHQNLKF